jgi:hypothetical protein
VRKELYLNNIWSSSEQNKIIYPSNTMLKSTALADRVADMLAAISTAAEALFKHTNKATTLRDKANLTRSKSPPTQASLCYWLV